MIQYKAQYGQRRLPRIVMPLEQCAVGKSSFVARLPVPELPLSSVEATGAVRSACGIPHIGDNDDVPLCVVSAYVHQPFVALYDTLADSVFADVVHVHHANHIALLPASISVSTGTANEKLRH